MKTTINYLLISFFVFCFANISASATNNNSGFGSSRQDSDNIKLKKGEAKKVYSNISFAAGNLTIKGDAKELMDGDFIYPGLNYIPEVSYSETPEIGYLDVKFNNPMINISNENQINWDIKLNNDVKTDLTIKMGAGIGNYYLGELNINNLNISFGAGDYYIDLRNSPVSDFQFKGGAGEAKIDLSGKRKTSLNADFVCGFGELTLILPENTAVRVIVSGLLGTVNAWGFNKNGNEYTNPAFRKTENIIDIKISAAMGEINLRLAE